MTRGRAGRPTKYDPKRMLPVVRAMAKLGATDVEFAQALGIGLSTFELWARTHPAFLRAIKPQKSAADDRVERSLYRKANGYSYDAEEIIPYDHIETTTRRGEDGKTELLTRTSEKRILRVPVVKHVPPSDTASIFWLKNRRKDRWRDFKATEISTPPGKPFEVTHGGPGEPELIGEYYARLKRAAAAGGPPGADPGADPGVGAGGQEPQGPSSGQAPGKG